MRTKHVIETAAVLILLIAGSWYVANRNPADTGSQSSPVVNGEDQAAVEAIVRDFGSNMKDVSLLAPAASLSATFDSEYGSFVAPELLNQWKADPSTALGRQTSNPYPESASIVSIAPQPDGSYVVETNIIEVTSATPNETAAVYPVSFRLERRGESWFIVSAERGAYSALPQRVTVTGRQICLPHRDTTGPQTLECALGFQTDEGVKYALDLNLMSSTEGAALINSGERVRIQGVITDAKALSADMWRKYDMEGIISVTSVSRI